MNSQQEIRIEVEILNEEITTTSTYSCPQRAPEDYDTYLGDGVYSGSVD